MGKAALKIVIWDSPKFFIMEGAKSQTARFW